MAVKAILGLFRYEDDTIKALENLKKEGFREIIALSPVPSHEIAEVLETEAPPFRLVLKALKDLFVNFFLKREGYLGRVTLLGSILGILTAFFIGGVTAILYPLQTGGMPILALPPIGLLTFEVMVLLSMVFTVLGFLFFAKLPDYRLEVYDKKISEDRFGIILRDTDERLSLGKEIMRNAGAESIEEKVLKPGEIG